MISVQLTYYPRFQGGGSNSPKSPFSMASGGGGGPMASSGGMPGGSMGPGMGMQGGLHSGGMSSSMSGPSAPGHSGSMFSPMGMKCVRHRIFCPQWCLVVDANGCHSCPCGPGEFKDILKCIN